MIVESDRRMSGVLPFLPSRVIRQILLIWAAWSVGILLLASAALVPPVANSSPWTSVFHAPPLARWDSVWYRSVATEGYQYDAGRRENNVGFYPLYPLCARAVSRLVSSRLLPTGIGLSFLCLGAALLLAADLFAEWGGAESALPSVAALLLFPVSFYFASFYTESLFLLATAAAIWGARRGRWAVAALGGAAAALTRFNGALVVLAIALIAWERAGRRWAGLRPGPALAAAATLAGAAAFPLYLWWRFGDPLLYVKSKSAGWSIRPSPVWRLAADVTRRVQDYVREPNLGEMLSYASQLGSALLFILLAIALFRRGLKAEGLYMAATMALLVSSGTLDAMDRFVLVLFPGFFVLAEFLRPRPALAFAYSFGGVGIGMVFLHRFVHWIMVS
ncbi:MAG: mannosyltransferase family protein [Thermoanaerobaculia bacterium]